MKILPDVNSQFHSILGAARINILSRSNSTKFLQGVSELKIDFIDTAPSYPDSEKRIGDFIKRNPNRFKIFTKYGRGDHDLNPKNLLKSVNSSLQTLHTEQLYGLSIHNRDANSISRGVFDMIIQLKAQGKINKFGWCGSWENLPYGLISNFDYLMLPVNPFINNLSTAMKDLTIPIIAMNPFANFFWNYRKTNNLKALINARLFKKFNPEPNYLKLYSNIVNPPSLDQLINFSVNFENVFGLCFGSIQLKHVLEISRSIKRLGKFI